MSRIFLGPALHKITGQSLAFHSAATIANQSDWVILTSKEGCSATEKLLLIVKGFTRFVLALMTGRVRIVYLTSSRTPLGFLRDALFIIFASILSRAKVVNHLHGSDFKSFRSGVSSFLGALIDWTYSRVDCSIILHESMYDQYTQYPSMRLEVVNNFLPEAEHYEDVPSVSQSGHVAIVLISNIILEKGLVDAICAVHELIVQGRDVSLTIAGAELDLKFDDLIAGDLIPRSYNRERIRYIGPVYGAAKRDLLSKSAIFVLPTYYEAEAMPISVIEALASGCAVVLSDWKYLRGIFGDFGVVFCRPQSPTSVRAALESIIDHPGKLARTRSVDASLARVRFSESVYKQRISEIFGELERDFDVCT
ncbi:MAG: glycosyltransferase family 4 protein [Mesorhizobium sp.]|nr:MAG: glycosyltransferase family 4 protein [Mesorhizobium sp.]